MVKYSDRCSNRSDTFMLTTCTHTTPKIDAANAASATTRGQGFGSEPLTARVFALAARCAP
jgi:hypothetical protein